MAAPVLRPLSTGEVLDTSFGLYRALFFPLVIVALVCRTVPDVLAIYLQQVSGTSLFAIFDHWQLLLVHFGLGIILTVVAVAASTVLVAGAYLGTPVTAGAALLKSFGLIGRLSLAAFLTSIAVFLGFLVLVVPGVILWSGLVLANAVIVLEQPISATASLGRSWDLSRGFRFKVFVSVLVAALLFVVPTMIVAVLAAIGNLAGVWSPLVSGILTSLLQIFVAPLMYVVVTVLYYDLRVRKEGFDLDLLATATRPAA
jgi:hypothetical protein